MKTNYLIAFAALTSVLGLSSYVWSEGPDGNAEPKSLLTAAFIPLTGSAAEQGEWIARGLELGREQVARRYGVSIHLRQEDTVADPKTAVSAYQSLRAREDFKVAFTYGSGVGIALSAPTNRDKVIQFGLATATPAYRSPDDFTFRNFPSAELEAAFLVHTTLADLGARELGIIKIENDFGIGSAKAFRAEYEKNGGKVIFEESIEPGATDFRSLLTRLRRFNAAVIYIAAYPGEGALFLKQARQLGIGAQFVASVAILGAKNFTDLAGEGAEGLLISSSTPAFLESKEPSVLEFVKLYREKYREEPGVQHIFAARAYDAMILIGQGYKKCGNDNTECLRDFLFGVKDFIGASGTLTFDRNGDVQNSFSLQQIKSGHLVAR